MAMQTQCYHDFFSSRGYLRSSWGYLGLMWGHLGATWVYLGPFLASCWPSDGARDLQQKALLSLNIRSLLIRGFLCFNFDYLAPSRPRPALLGRLGLFLVFFGGPFGALWCILRALLGISWLILGPSWVALGLRWGSHFLKVFPYFVICVSQYLARSVSPYLGISVHRYFAKVIDRSISVSRPSWKHYFEL